jgi:hypothetical protein
LGEVIFSSGGPTGIPFNVQQCDKSIADFPTGEVRDVNTGILTLTTTLNKSDESR